MRERYDNPRRNESGYYDAFGWPGGYPLYYIVGTPRDNETEICPRCANEALRKAALDALYWGETEVDDWKVNAAGVNYEDIGLFCERCNRRIPSAYCEDDFNEREFKARSGQLWEYQTSAGWYRLKIQVSHHNGERWYLQYVLVGPDWEEIFAGNDIGMGATDSALEARTGKTAGLVLGLLTLRPGDTDQEYFDKYTLIQREFLESGPVEELAIWGMELRGELTGKEEEGGSDGPYDEIETENEPGSDSKAELELEAMEREEGIDRW